MVDFAAADGSIAVRRKVLGDGDGVFENGRLSPGVGVVIYAGA